MDEKINSFFAKSCQKITILDPSILYKLYILKNEFQLVDSFGWRYLKIFSDFTQEKSKQAAR